MNDFIKGYIIGLIEGRGSFHYRLDRNIPVFIFRVELSKVRKEAISFLRKYFGFGNISRYRKQLFYGVASQKDIPQVIKFIDKYSFVQTQNYIIYKLWRNIFCEYNSIRLELEKEHLHRRQYNTNVFRKYAVQFSKLLKSKVVKPISGMNYKTESDELIAGFICGIIDTKGFFDFRVYKEQKSGLNYPQYNPRFPFYIVLNRNDNELACLIRETLNCGKIYKRKNDIQFTLNSQEEVWKMTRFMDKYFDMKPRVIEYKIWSSIFFNTMQHKPPKGKRYEPYHMSVLFDMDNLYNRKKRIYMSEKKLNELVKGIKAKFDKREQREILDKRNIIIN